MRLKCVPVFFSLFALILSFAQAADEIDASYFSDDLYQILGVPRDASRDVIERAYEHRWEDLNLYFDAKLSYNREPQAINRFWKAKDRLYDAYSSLADPKKRSAYDQKLLSIESPPPTLRSAQLTAQPDSIKPSKRGEMKIEIEHRYSGATTESRELLKDSHRQLYDLAHPDTEQDPEIDALVDTLRMQTCPSTLRGRK